MSSRSKAGALGSQKPAAHEEEGSRREPGLFAETEDEVAWPSPFAFLVLSPVLVDAQDSCAAATNTLKTIGPEACLILHASRRTAGMEVICQVDWSIVERQELGHLQSALLKAMIPPWQSLRVLKVASGCFSDNMLCLHRTWTRMTGSSCASRSQIH